MKDWIEIFKSGSHTSSNGTTRTWTNADLDKMVASYCGAEHEAPVVIGHPKSNDPAYGWLAEVKRAGDVLLGRFKQVAPEFAEMVAQGRFKKRSISVYPDGSIRHVGFLGAQPPAIKGLRDIEFEESDADIYEFKEKEADMPTVEELQKKLDEEVKKREAAEKKAGDAESRADKAEADFAESQDRAMKKEISDFVESGTQSGKILPAWKDLGISEFMQDLAGQEETICFSEGKRQTRLDWFKGFINSFSEHSLFKEMASPDAARNKRADKDTDFAEDEKAAEEDAKNYQWNS